jgi:tRNA pseudouridine38-40 synthase
LNRILPPDIAVGSSELVSERFHSRFCAFSRSYRYRIAIGPRDPMDARYVYNHWEALDAAAMTLAASALVGLHDFRAYTEELDPRIENTVRRLFRVAVRPKGREIWIDVEGTAFLRGMMRRIAGALFEVGRGLRSARDAGDLLTERRSDLQWPVVLPAKGLALMRVKYGRHPVDNREKAGEREQLENDLTE